MSSYQQPQINSNQSSTDDDDISTIPCPLDLQGFRDEASEKQSIGLQHLKEIELHFQNCENSELKDIIFKNPRTETPDDPYFDQKLHYIRGSLSPLHKACFYGELDSVKHIVENWKVDMNQLASFCPAYGGQSMIDKATPLFVAATMGHIEVVRYLVEAGADVSAKSSSKYDIYKSSSDQPKSFRGLTPLYGVVVGSRHVILNSQRQSDDRENRRGIVRTLLSAGAAPTLHDINILHDFPLLMSELMGIDSAAANYVKSIAALIDDYGLDLNHRTPNDEGGNTILHFFTSWIGSSRDKGHTEEESLAIVQLLLERGADPKSKNAMGFTPIMRSAYYLRLPVLNFLLGRNEISRREKVDALELVGAVILVGIHSSSAYQDEAYQYWRKSLQLRQNADGTVSQKILRTGRVQEWVTSEELDRVINNPSEHKIQSFLVGMRILSGISWNAVKSFFGRFEDLLRNTTSYSIIQKISMLWVMLDTIRCFDVREKGLWFVTLQTAGSLIETLLKLEREDLFMNHETIQTTLQLILTTDQFHKTNRESLEPWIINNYIRELLRLIKMLAGSPQIMNEENMELLYELVRRDGRRDSGRKSLLHMACEANVPDADRLPILRLLLGAGVDPDVADSNGDRPLHYLAKLNGSSIDYAARLLLDAGAYPDRRNKEGKSVSDVWIESHPETRKRNTSGDQRATRKSDVPSWFCDDSVPTLFCLSGRAIRSERVPHSSEEVPSLVLRFLRMQHELYELYN